MASIRKNAPVELESSLSKEEKEILLEKKMQEMRQKNAALQKRHEEIEADRRAAEMQGRAVNTKLQTSTAPLSPKRDIMKGVSENGRTEDRKSAFSAGRGKRLERVTQEKQRTREEGKPQGMENTPQGHSRLEQAQRGAGEDGRPAHPGRRFPGRGKPPLPGRGKPPLPGCPYSDNNPPPDPGFSFLADRGRQGVAAQDRAPKGWGNQGRHPRNYGGSSFTDVKDKMRAARDKHQGRQTGSPRSDMEVTMTGKERRDYVAWKAEREMIDTARIQRGKAASGEWKREWDIEKDENFEPPPACPPSPKSLAPHRRPAGRIGSGRFQRTRQGSAERPVSAGVHQGPQWSGRGRGRHKAPSPAPGRRRRSSANSEDHNSDNQNSTLIIRIDNEFATAAAGAADVNGPEKKVKFKPPASPANPGNARSNGAVRGKQSERPANRGVARRQGGVVGSGRLNPGSSWQPVDTEEYWEDEGAIMPPVSDTPHIRPLMAVPSAAPEPAAPSPKLKRANAGPVEHPKPKTAVVKQIKPPVKKEKVLEETVQEEGGEEVVGAAEDDDDEWQDIDDPHDFYNMRHGSLGEFSDEEDKHNSSTESLERFIEENTLRIDEKTGLAAQSPSASQTSTSSQPSQSSSLMKTPPGHVKVSDWSEDVDHLNDSKGSSSDASDHLGTPTKGSVVPSADMPADGLAGDQGKTDGQETDTQDDTRGQQKQSMSSGDAQSPVVPDTSACETDTTTSADATSVIRAAAESDHSTIEENVAVAESEEQLNSTPVNCGSETEKTLTMTENIKTEATMASEELAESSLMEEGSGKDNMRTDTEVSKHELDERNSASKPDAASQPGIDSSQGDATGTCESEAICEPVGIAEPAVDRSDSAVDSCDSAAAQPGVEENSQPGTDEAGDTQPVDRTPDGGKVTSPAASQPQDKEEETNVHEDITSS